jgi:hypothetical protein
VKILVRIRIKVKKWIVIFWPGFYQSGILDVGTRIKTQQKKSKNMLCSHLIHENENFLLIK